MQKIDADRCEPRDLEEIDEAVAVQLRFGAELLLKTPPPAFVAVVINPTKEINVTADGAEKVITLTATASGKVQPKFSTTTGWNIDWLAHDAASYKSEVVDGVTTSTMTFKYTLTADAPYVPVTLTLAHRR